MMKSPSILVAKNEKKEEQKIKMALDCRDKAITTLDKAKKNDDRENDSDEVSEKKVRVKRREKKAQEVVLMPLHFWQKKQSFESKNLL